MKRTKPKKQITTLAVLGRVITILSKIARARDADPRLTLSGDGSNLVIAASLEKTTLKMGESGSVPGKLWLEYRAAAEGGLTREVGIEPRLFKVAAGAAKGLALEVKTEKVVEKNRPVEKRIARITDLDGVTTECPVLGSDYVEKARKFEGHLYGAATVGELLGPFLWSYRAISTDGDRPQLAALALTGVRVAGTDGHRLHVAPLPNGIEVSIGSLIPFIGARALLEIFKVSPKSSVVTFSGNDEGMNIEIGGRWFMSFAFTTYSGTSDPVRFPPYHKVIPSPWDRPGGLVVKTDSGKLLKAMKKASQVLKGGTEHYVKIQPEADLVRVIADNPTDDLFVNMTVPASTVGNPGFLLGANAEYLVDALLPEGEVTIYLGPEYSHPDSGPAGYTIDASVWSVGEDQFGVVMPIRP